MYALQTAFAEYPISHSMMKEASSLIHKPPNQSSFHGFHISGQYNIELKPIPSHAQLVEVAAKAAAAATMATSAINQNIQISVCSTSSLHRGEVENERLLIDYKNSASPESISCPVNEVAVCRVYPDCKEELFNRGNNNHIHLSCRERATGQDNHFFSRNITNMFH